MPLCVKGVGWSGCGRGRRVVARPGSGFPEEPVFWGCDPVALVAEPFPLLPSRVPDLVCCAPRVCAEAGEDGVADLALERAQGLPVRFSVGQLFVVVGAA